MRTGGNADVAFRSTDAGYDGGSIFSPPTDVTGMNEPYEEKLRRALRA